jgi:hypothetical protein
MWPVNQEFPNTTVLEYNYAFKERSYDKWIVIKSSILMLIRLKELFIEGSRKNHLQGIL